MEDGMVMEIDTHKGRTLRLFLFDDVANSKDLLKSLQDGTLQPEVALFNAALVPDVFPVLAAAHRSLLSQERGTLVTRTLHAELIYNYSGSKHITESLRRCGISDNTKYVLVAQFDCPSDKVDDVKKLIQGTQIDVQQLEKKADIASVEKHYKISKLELEVSSLADAMVCRIAARDAM